MDRRNQNNRHLTPAGRGSSPRRMTVPSREQLLTAKAPKVVAQATPAQVAHSSDNNSQRVTLENFQAPVHHPEAVHRNHHYNHHDQAIQQPTSVEFHRTQPLVAPQNHHSPMPRPQYYPAQAAAQARPVVYQQYPVANHQPVYTHPAQAQHYQRAMAAARQHTAALPMQQPAMAGAGNLPMVQPHKNSAIKPYTDSAKNSVNKLKNTKIGKAIEKLKPTGKLRPSDIVRYAVVTFFVVMACYLAFDTWHTNQQIQSVFQPEPAAAVSTEEPVVSNGPAFPDYKVPADQPRIIEIPKISLTARVKAVGLTASSKVDVPADASFAGWYQDSAYLGKEGASFITGHYNGTNAGGVFDNLRNVADGDMIAVEMGNGAKYNYQVVHVDNLPVNQVDMTKALNPYDDVEEGLNIMTCSGSFNGAGFTHRLIVYTKRV